VKRCKLQIILWRDFTITLLAEAVLPRWTRTPRRIEIPSTLIRFRNDAFSKTHQTLRVHTTVSVAFSPSTPKRSKTLMPDTTVTCECHTCEWLQRLRRREYDRARFSTVSWLWTAFIFSNVYVFAENDLCLPKMHKICVFKIENALVWTGPETSEQTYPTKTRNYNRPMCSKSIDYSVLTHKNLLHLL